MILFPGRGEDPASGHPQHLADILQFTPSNQHNIQVAKGDSRGISGKIMEKTPKYPGKWA
jgi:hypothetical protein